MERADAIVASIGVLVVTAAGGGILLSGGTAPSLSFSLAWQTEKGSLQTRGSFAGDEVAENAFPLDVRNLTRVAVTLDVQAPGPRAGDELVRVTLSGPGNRTAAGETRFQAGSTAQGRVTLQIPLASVPRRVAVTATSEAEARTALMGDASDLGRGPWTVSVDANPEFPGPHLESHTFTIALEFERYFALLESEAAR